MRTFMSTICSIVCRGCLILTFVVIQGVWSPLCAQEDEQEPVYTVVKQMPKFQDGDLNTFRNWVQRELHHPTNADGKQITGRVICNFIVEKDGSVGDVGVLQSPDSLLALETVRVVRSSPKWEPGIQKDRPVRVRLTIPVEFRENRKSSLVINLK